MRAHVVAAALVLGCAPSVAPRYARERAAAERAYSAGRYLEAADAWQRAADAATRRRDRDEARYRKAVSLARAGKREAAASEYEKIARNERTERAARALFDLASMASKDGDEHAMVAKLDELLRRYPNSGLAPRALALRLDEIRAHGGEDEAQRFLDGLLRRGTHRELAQYAQYSYAESLEREGKLAGALERYLLVAERYGYPDGPLWDDALWRAADIEARQQHPGRAIELLREMLAHRESSFWQGSYERPRYADAQYRIAELYRDSLRSPDRARVEFRRVFAEHPSSRLRDDAKWQEALLAHREGDAAGACRAVAELVGSVPDSRYAACTQLVCPHSRSNVNAKRCRDYIRRDVAQGGGARGARRSSEPP